MFDWFKRPKQKPKKEQCLYPPPCGHPDHYYWEGEGWPCAICYSRDIQKTRDAEEEAKRLEKDRDLEKLADLLSDKLAQKLEARLKEISHE